jgi:hypothetical protein
MRGGNLPAFASACHRLRDAISTGPTARQSGDFWLLSVRAPSRPWLPPGWRDNFRHTLRAAAFLGDYTLASNFIRVANHFTTQPRDSQEQHVPACCSQ